MHGRQLCCYHCAHGVANHMNLFPLEGVLHCCPLSIINCATAICSKLNTGRTSCAWQAKSLRDQLQAIASQIKFLMFLLATDAKPCQPVQTCLHMSKHTGLSRTRAVALRQSNFSNLCR